VLGTSTRTSDVLINVVRVLLVPVRCGQASMRRNARPSVVRKGAFGELTTVGASRWRRGHSAVNGSEPCAAVDGPRPGRRGDADSKVPTRPGDCAAAGATLERGLGVQCGPGATPASGRRPVPRGAGPLVQMSRVTRRRKDPSSYKSTRMARCAHEPALASESGRCRSNTAQRGRPWRSSIFSSAHDYRICCCGCCICIHRRHHPTGKQRAL
jgi:hypothetical protein